jgi:hypothetical protein
MTGITAPQQVNVISFCSRGTPMKTVTMPVIAGAIVAAALGLAASANAAPMGPNVSQTVERLQAEGFHVIVNKTGNAPLEQCAVNAVRPGQTYTRMESEIPGPADRGVGIVTTVTGKTVYLDVAC